MRLYYRRVKQYVVPVVFPVFFTLCALVLPLAGQISTGSGLSLTSLIATATSLDSVALCTVSLYLLWAYLSLVLSSNTVFGPKTSFGHTPPYKGNGVEYYCYTVVTVCLVYSAWPESALLAYRHMPNIVAALNMLAFIVCILLTVKGVLNPDHRENIDAPPQTIFNLAYRFWCGSELHPRLLGVDIKQLIICRVGLMAWQQLIIAFFAASLYLHGFSLPLFYNVLLQFFWWEVGYFHTIDMMEDRASYYLCWGCLVWVPVLYTWSTYYMVERPSELGTLVSTLIALVGLAAILLNYLVDLERQIFRRTGKSFLGQTTHMDVTYTDDSGVEHKSALLTSGLWGRARHLNYTFELLLTFCWCLESGGMTAAHGHGAVSPFLYFYFLTALLLHRFYRDDERCRRKYGDKQWDAYCLAVPDRFIPYIF